MLIRFAPLIDWLERAMPFLLVFVPVAAALLAKGRRLRRFVEALGSVLVLGLILLVLKIMLSAEVAQKKSGERSVRSENSVSK